MAIPGVIPTERLMSLTGDESQGSVGALNGASDAY